MTCEECEARFSPGVTHAGAPSSKCPFCGVLLDLEVTDG